MANPNGQNPTNSLQNDRPSGMSGTPSVVVQGGMGGASLDPQSDQGSQKSLIDSGGLSAPAAELFKQLLSSMAGNKAVEDGKPMGNLSVDEKMNQGSQEKATDIAKSSTHGEARGVRVHPKPYCH
jgi:hypothetical protein